MQAISAACSVRTRFALLSEHPHAGRARDEITAGVRSFAVESYVIYYRPDAHGVSITRILYGSRDQPAAFGEPQYAPGGAFRDSGTPMIDAPSLIVPRELSSQAAAAVSRYPLVAGSMLR